MKNIWKIFTGDLKKLVKQPFALVIIIGLCVIPSLYAWFNIFANWDPYANTGGIPVAVVSLDQDYTLKDGSVVNMGESVLESLHSKPLPLEALITYLQNPLVAATGEPIKI